VTALPQPVGRGRYIRDFAADLARPGLKLRIATEAGGGPAPVRAVVTARNLDGWSSGQLSVVGVDAGGTRFADDLGLLSAAGGPLRIDGLEGIAEIRVVAPASLSGTADISIDLYAPAPSAFASVREA
jgi:hypothetical protein